MTIAENTEVSFLKGEIEKSIKTLKEKSQKNKIKTGTINGLSILLGALITLTLGFDISTEYILHQKNIALVLAAFLTFVNGWGAIFDYRKLWARQKSTLLSLYQIKNELGYRISQGESNVFDLFEKYLDIWEKDSDEWRGIANSQSYKKIENGIIEDNR